MPMLVMEARRRSTPKMRPPSSATVLLGVAAWPRRIWAPNLLLSRKEVEVQSQAVVLLLEISQRKRPVLKLLRAMVLPEVDQIVRLLSVKIQILGLGVGMVMQAINLLARIGMLEMPEVRPMVAVWLWFRRVVRLGVWKWQGRKMLDLQARTTLLKHLQLSRIRNRLVVLQIIRREQLLMVVLVQPKQSPQNLEIIVIMWAGHHQQRLVVLVKTRRLTGLMRWPVVICSMGVGLEMTPTLSTQRDHVLPSMSRLTATLTAGEI
jgi:hypothetical protein